MKIGVRHETVGFSDSINRIRIAHLSDLHLWFSDRKLHVIEQLLVDWKPEVLALTGDYADTPRGRRLMVAWTRRIARTYPVCWVAGNHDRWGGAQFLTEMGALSGVHSIDRRDAWLEAKQGCRFRFTSLERLSNGATGETAPTVVLLHDPAAILPEKLPAEENCLLLAGHLHGGQVTLWRDRAGRGQPAATCYRWLADRTEIGPVPLLVSRGLGDTFPLRFRTPREIVVIDFFANETAPTTTKPSNLRGVGAKAH